MTDGMSLGRQQAGQLAGTLTGPPERGHGIASGIRVNQSFQRLDQLGVVLDQRLPSSSRVPYSLNGERWLSKALDSPIDGRTRESGKTGDAGNTPSSQLLCIDGSDKVLLSLIQVRKQQAVFLLKFFCCAHTDSVTQCASFVTIINLRALTFAHKLMLHTPAYHRNRQAVRDRITNYTQVNELGVRNMHGATRTSQPKSLRIRLL